MKKSIICIMFIFICISIAFADPIYFDEDGNQISYSVYKRIISDKQKRARAKLKAKQASKSEKVKQVKSAKAKKAEIQKAETNKEVDIFGRPLKDSEGRWITYPGEENPTAHRYYPKPGESDYAKSIKYRNQKLAAERADDYWDKYWKTGKTTDLLEYRKARREALWGK